jgi:hypothetical protein
MAHAYGMKVFFYKAFLGFYQSDIGVIGEYSKYGVLWIFCVFLISRQLFVMKSEPRFQYIKFYALNLMFDLVINGAFSRSYEIAVITSILYIYDVSDYEYKNPDENLEKSTILS